MYFYKFLIVSFLIVSFGACNSTNSSEKKLFSLEIKGKTNKIQHGKTVEIDLRNKKNKEIDSVSYQLNGKSINVNNNSFTLKSDKLGIQPLKATVYYEGTSTEVVKNITILAEEAPKVYTYEIINTYPHDIKAYTQGLEFHNDTLYESTGRKGISSLRKVDYKTGDVLKKIDLDDSYFGEGITIIDQKIYMLTWQAGKGFIYDLNTFEKLDSFQYNKSKEGWGLTHTPDGGKIYKSDGSDKIWILNPKTLVEEDFIETVTNTSVFNKANELEYVDGKIYANVYLKDSAMIIDAKTGAIIGVIDFRGLKDKVKQHADLDVLNGIAYNPKTDTFFVTGKNWDKMFEVSIKEKN
ncbi:glutaminyl-peptide cyclotransferase [Galbibacter sp. BG1]|uniref:glutaminyl-peptide cyclotransferase n=1 Tax=Galbibacter sp. BG1 TaxID=1170699 RepID=UPI0015B9880B|nr:glutaminyl-peptide cyclotransferase [Galbibacter sp. BG1]QLE02566.1 glutaminyl-peptide cyclotransferase [Galbibacter sp. BG1]